MKTPALAIARKPGAVKDLVDRYLALRPADQAAFRSAISPTPEPAIDLDALSLSTFQRRLLRRLLAAGIGAAVPADALLAAVYGRRERGPEKRRDQLRALRSICDRAERAILELGFLIDADRGAYILLAAASLRKHADV